MKRAEACGRPENRHVAFSDLGHDRDPDAGHRQSDRQESICGSSALRRRARQASQRRQLRSASASVCALRRFPIAERALDSFQQSNGRLTIGAALRSWSFPWRSNANMGNWAVRIASDSEAIQVGASAAIPLGCLAFARYDDSGGELPIGSRVERFRNASCMSLQRGANL